MIFKDCMQCLQPDNPTIHINHSFHDSKSPNMMEKLVSITVIVMQAQQMYNGLLQTLKEEYTADKIFDGEFGAMMDVSLVNDGPVT
jgi:hypothetical protein